jgi:DNA-binding NtrC family response regulator
MEKEGIMSPSTQTSHKSFGEQEAVWAEGNASVRDRNGAAQATAGVTPLRPHLTTPLVGCSPVMKHLSTIIERVAPTNSSVFITGATGTGKELVARSIHAQSPRRKAPFVDINCAAIPETLLETELFGHQRGTFTGAHETRRGLIESASGGTLFLDEVDALPLSAQVKLLRVLQERSLRRVGGRENIPVDVRIISATNRDLQRAVAEGAFRADLLFRLRVVPIRVPDLRERGDEDIRLLVDYFLRHRGEHGGSRPRSFSAAAMRALMACRWPGNVRELENTVEYALAIGSGDELGLDDLPPDVLQGDTGDCDMLRECMRHGETLAELERRYILSVLERCGGHQLNTAAVLGIDRRTLYRKLKEYGVTANSHAGAVRVLAEIPRLAGEEVSRFREFDVSFERGNERAA